MRDQIYNAISVAIIILALLLCGSCSRESRETVDEQRVDLVGYNLHLVGTIGAMPVDLVLDVTGKIESDTQRETEGKVEYKAPAWSMELLGLILGAVGIGAGGTAGVAKFAGWIGKLKSTIGGLTSGINTFAGSTNDSEAKALFHALSEHLGGSEKAIVKASKQSQGLQDISGRLRG
jgi:hypothetical protein